MAKTAEQKAAEAKAKADAAAAKKAAAAQKKADQAKVTALKEAQKAETIALKASLKTQGLMSSSEINKAVNAEKKANDAELKTVKETVKTSGYANVPQVSKAATYTGQTAYDVSKTLTSAAGLYSQYGIQPITSAGGDGSYTGVSLANLTKAVLNKDANGLFTQGTGDTKVPSSVYKTLTDATTNYGKTLTAADVGKVKSIGTDANGNQLYSKTISGGDTAGYGVYKLNNDGTYTNVGYTGSYTPPQDNGGFFSSTLGKIALAGGAILTGGALAPYIGATLGTGTIASGAIAGGIVGAGTSALTGGNIGQGVLLGAAGGAIGGAFQNASGLTEAEFAAYDYQNLASQGLSADQIASTMTASGYNPNTISAVTQAAASGATTAADIGSVANQTLTTQGNAPTGTTGGYNVQRFDDGTVLVTDNAGQVVGGTNTAGQTFGNINVQTFDDGTTLISDSNYRPISGTDTAGQTFTVGSNGQAVYDATGGQLGGQPTTTFGGSLAPTSLLSGLGGAGAAGTGLGNALTTAAGGLLSGSNIGGALQTAAGLGLAAEDRAALREYAGKIEAAGAKAAPQMQFQPVGVTTRFGATTTPQYDANGRLIGYGYTAAEDIAAQRDRLLGLSNQALPTTTNIQQATQDYYNQVQNLMNPQREQSLAGIKANLQATGRGGLAFGATTGAGGANALAATNPELAAYYNALAQQQAQQALTAQDIAQQRLTQQIATSGTLFGQAKDLETAAQQPMTLGMQYGQQATNASQAAAAQQYRSAVDAAKLYADATTGFNKNLGTMAAGSSGLFNTAGNLISQGINYLF